MRAFSKVILLAMVLTSFIFTFSSFPYFKDTYAAFIDTKYADAIFTSGTWDAQASLARLSDFIIPGNSAKLLEIALGTGGNQNTTTADRNSSGSNSSNYGSSFNNSTNNSSAAGNDIFNLTANNMTTSNLTANNLTTNNLTANNLTTANGNGMGSSGSTTISEKLPSVSPVANFSSNITSGYAPLSVQFKELSENATEWNWDFGDENTSSEQNPAHFYSLAGYYNVNLVVSNSNGTNSKLATITVLEKPAIVFPPVAKFSVSAANGFVPFSVQFTDFSENATKWDWDFGDGTGSTEQNPTHIYSAVGTYPVNLTVSNTNGTNSTSSTIIVLQPILPVSNFSNNVTSGYTPLSVQFTDLSNNSAGWNWEFGDGVISTEQNPAHTYSAAGIYAVNLTTINANGTDTKLTTIKVLEQPAAVFPVANFINNVTSGYAPLYVQFIDLSNNATEWNWNFGDGDISTDQNPVHIYFAAGNYTVTLKVSNSNGTNSKLETITVLEKPAIVFPPVAKFSVSAANGFVPFSAQFTDFSENATKWDWDFGDGNTSTAQNPVHTYSTAGDYEVRLTVTNAAGTVAEAKKSYINVRIASSVKLTSITLDGENSVGVTTNSGASTTNTEDSLGQVGVRNETGVFLNQPYSGGSLGEVSIPLGLGINNFTLVADGVFPGNENYGAVLFFDGAITLPQIVVCNSNNKVGNFSVQLEGTNITSSANGGSLLDKAPGTSVYTAPDGTKIEMVSFVVDSKSGNTDEVSGENIGSNGIPDTTAKLSLKVTLSSIIPVAGFSTSTTTGNVPLEVAFTEASTGFPNSWKWDFGDGTGSTEQNPSHTYSTAGAYTVNLTVSNTNGTNSTSSTITVLQPVFPVSNFISNITSGYTPLSVQLTDLSNNTAGWNWDFGDGIISTEQSPAHTYSTAGNYAVNLTAINANGTDSKLTTIKVLEQPAAVFPVANFSNNVTSGYAPLSVQFTDLSNNATEWNWDFGDGAISTEQNPVHIYFAAGNYTVTLKVSNKSGQDAKTSQIYVDKTSDNPVAVNSSNNP